MLVVDGSVLLAWAVQAPASAAAAALPEEETELAAPQSALVEAVEGARRLARLGHVSGEDLARLPGLLAPLLTILAADASLMPQAARLAEEHELALPAALALALAQVRQGRLATLDAKLAQAAEQVLGAERVRLLRA